MTVKIIYALGIVLCLASVLTPPLALLGGALAAQIFKMPVQRAAGRVKNFLLQFSIVILGLSMNASDVMKGGGRGVLIISLSVVLVLVLGYILGRFINNDSRLSMLISAGTAICGGSAIAASAPVVKADERQISAALAVVFVLNGAALLLFPAIGQFLKMSSLQFGVWCAAAIQDTSSVVGAAGQFSDQALRIAAPLKLARALWIIPLTLLSPYFFKAADRKIKPPYFTGLFILAVLAGTYMAPVSSLSVYFIAAAKKGMTTSLFLIGAGLSGGTIKEAAGRAFLQGFILWILLSVVSLSAVLFFLK